jgi:NAD-dependent dihydropyrimidine dehydrogenase PreA subunit
VKATTPAVQRVLIYEGGDSHPLHDDERLRLLTMLLERGYSVGIIRPGSGLPDLGHRELIVLGKFVGKLPALATAGSGDVKLHFEDISDLDAEGAVERVAAACEREQHADGTANGWKPWFPVIDFDRCTNCMQCLSFCLFDVYGVSQEGKISVQNQSNCKTDCPACSRVCPEVAILFPKYKAGPINGDEISDEDLRRESMKVDISALLGGDIYSMLRDRSAKAKSRFSKERDDERALKERQRCLKKLQGAMDDLEIPAELLSSLPSADQIQAKAEAAKRSAQEALEQNGRIR